MRLPQDVSGPRLVAVLRRLGYEVVRRRGSHARVTTHLKGEHHEVVPMRSPIKVNTLSFGLPPTLRNLFPIKTSKRDRPCSITRESQRRCCVLLLRIARTGFAGTATGARSTRNAALRSFCRRVSLDWYSERRLLRKHRTWTQVFMLPRSLKSAPRQASVP